MRYQLFPARRQKKSGVTPVIRLAWAPEGDEVFVYDASECLGTLDVSLKDDDVRYAYLSGTIDYNGQSSIAEQLVNFSFATSVVNVNCIGLATDGQNQEQIEKASISGLQRDVQYGCSRRKRQSGH